MTRILLIGTMCLAAGLGSAQAQSGKKSGAGSPATPVIGCASVAYSGGEVACSCPAEASGGSVWGSGPYTADSNICTAARHSGAIGAEGGVVRLVERPGQASYSGSTANGVSSSDWGSYGQSYDVVGGRPAVSVLPACGVIPDGVDVYACQCAADASRGSVWGNGPYTADSSICAAAIHAGYLDEAGGDAYVLRVPGLAAYHGAEGYGVTTSDWGAYGSSIVFDWNQ